MRATYTGTATSIEGWLAARKKALRADQDLSQIVVMQLSHGDKIGACALYRWEDDDTMACAFVMEPWAKRLVTRDNIGDMHRFPYMLGANRLVTETADPDTRSMLIRLGWIQADDNSFTVKLPTGWSSYGCIQFTKSARAGTTAAVADTRRSRDRRGERKAAPREQATGGPA